MLLPSPFFLLLIVTAVITYELKSPVVTNWGDWYEWSNCPAGTFAAGLQIKAEGDLRGKDDTGVNAISLYCRPLNWRGQNKDTWIMSGEGLWGSWGNIKWCPEGQVLIGFQLRSEPDQRGGDDVATANFAGYCGSPYGERDANNWIAGDTVPWGDWTQTQWCPKGRAICSIKTQIEGDQGGGDDTALNNVNVWCCEAKDESSDCTPDVKRVTISNEDNRRGAAETSYEYTVTVAFTHMSSNTQTVTTHEKQTLANKVSVELGSSNSALSTKVASEFSDSIERGSMNSLQRMVQDTVQKTYQEKRTIRVPAGKRVGVDQVIFTCGDYQVGVPMTIHYQY